MEWRRHRGDPGPITAAVAVPVGSRNWARQWVRAPANDGEPSVNVSPSIFERTSINHGRRLGGHHIDGRITNI